MEAFVLSSMLVMARMTSLLKVPYDLDVVVMIY